MVVARQREGDAISEAFLMWVDCTISVLQKLEPSEISLVSVSDMNQEDLCWCDILNVQY